VLPSITRLLSSLRFFLIPETFTGVASSVVYSLQETLEDDF
jgi:hypothetical protein